jgi:predicted RNase H-like HicB family nuclease
MQELIFEITQESDGGYTAEALGESIFTQGDSWDALRRNVSEAVEAYYFDTEKPSRVRLRLVRDEMLAVG